MFLILEQFVYTIFFLFQKSQEKYN